MNDKANPNPDGLDAGVRRGDFAVRTSFVRGLRSFADSGREAFRREQGASIVEFAVAASVYFALFFGLIQICLALYSYNFVADAAREATRYVAVRGVNSCTVSSTFPNCNLLPTNITSSTNNPVLTYIESMNYPGLNASNLSATVTWYVSSQNANGQTSWPTACVGAKDTNGNACNNIGNAVKVVVSYRFPLSIPYWKNATVPVSSTSQMVISE